MKLSELKVGMVVSHKLLAEYEVLFVGESKFFARGRGGNDESMFVANDEWKIIEPRKKPSQLVQESLVGKIYLTFGGNSAIGGRQENAIYANDRIDAILKYLDEQASEQK